MAKFWENFLFGLAFGMGFIISYGLLKIVGEFIIKLIGQAGHPIL